MKYLVTLTEVTGCTVEVEAESQSQAELQVLEMARCGTLPCNLEVIERSANGEPVQPAPSGLGPVPESAAECEYGDDEYQWRLRQAGL
jgi:hypothetical protein